MEKAQDFSFAPRAVAGRAPKLQEAPNPKGLGNTAEQGTRKWGQSQGRSSSKPRGTRVGGRTTRSRLPCPKLSLLFGGQKPKDRCGELGISLDFIVG